MFNIYNTILSSFMEEITNTTGISVDSLNTSTSDVLDNIRLEESPNDEELDLLEEIIEDTTPSDTTNTEETSETQEINNDYIIPTNSKTLLVHEETSRFSGATWFNEIQKADIILAGLGGIGSWVALMLSRLNVKSVIMYDDDKVETGNLSGQLYGVTKIGKYKADAVAEEMMDFSKFYNYVCYRYKYTNTDGRTAPIMICGFDNMAARKTFYHAWKSMMLKHIDAYRKSCLFIDGRLAAEEFQIFCIKGDDTASMLKYEKDWLFDDSEAEATQCSYKQTSFCASMIASFIANIFVNFIANKCNPLFERDVPFLTRYNAETLFLTTEA